MRMDSGQYRKVSYLSNLPAIRDINMDLLKRCKKQSWDLVALVYNPGTPEVEAGDWRVQGQLN